MSVCLHSINLCVCVCILFLVFGRVRAFRRRTVFIIELSVEFAQFIQLSSKFYESTRNCAYNFFVTVFFKCDLVIKINMDAAENQ